MRFIGGKTLIILYILELIKEKTIDVKSISDVFAGSGVVSREFKNLGISDPIAYLNNLNLENMNLDLANCFICQNYSPNGERMYFTEENALRIDFIRIQIENWYEASMINEDEYFYLLTCLIEAVPFVSNITGVYGAYSSR